MEGVCLYRQHSQSRENINFPEDEIMEGAEGGGDLGPSPGPGRNHTTQLIKKNEIYIPEY